MPTSRWKAVPAKPSSRTATSSIGGTRNPRPCPRGGRVSEASRSAVIVREIGSLGGGSGNRPECIILANLPQPSDQMGYGFLLRRFSAVATPPARPIHDILCHPVLLNQSRLPGGRSSHRGESWNLSSRNTAWDAMVLNRRLEDSSLTLDTLSVTWTATGANGGRQEDRSPPDLPRHR
jgi:hypothetical protein